MRPRPCGSTLNQKTNLADQGMLPPRDAFRVWRQCARVRALQTIKSLAVAFYVVVGMCVPQAIAADATPPAAMAAQPSSSLQPPLAAYQPAAVALPQVASTGTITPAIASAAGNPHLNPANVATPAQGMAPMGQLIASVPPVDPQNQYSVQQASGYASVPPHVPPATSAPGAPGGYYGQLASLQPAAPPGGPAPGLDLSNSDILQRLQAAEAELAAMREQMAPRDKRLGDLEEASKRAAAIDKPLPLIRLSGFFQYDTGWFSQDFNSKDVLGNIQNGTGFRRTRLQGLGQLTEFTTFSIEMDFAFPGRPSFMDVWGEQSNLPIVGHARIGQYRQPVTMDSWTNIKHLEFLERSAPFIAMDPFRRVGIMGWDNSEDERTMWAYSLFGTGWTFWNGASQVYNTEGNDNRFGTQLGDSGGISFSTRVTHLLYYDPHANNRYLMHVGGGYLFGELGGSGTTGTNAKAYEARTIPEFFVGDQGGAFVTASGTPNVIDTGRILATNYQLLHAEVAGSWGPAHYQAEYMATFLQQLGGGTVFFDGGYIQGGVFLTGENTGYNKLMGAMDYNVKPNSEFFGIGRKKPLCGWGAWELAARWSWVDLSSKQVRAENYVPGQSTFPAAIPPPVINPGVLNEPTIALNWWWNQYMRVQFNYIHSMVQSNSAGFYATDIFALRFQTEF